MDVVKMRSKIIERKDMHNNKFYDLYEDGKYIKSEVRKELLLKN